MLQFLDAQDMTPADLQVRELRNAHESVGRERRGIVDGMIVFVIKTIFVIVVVLNLPSLL